MQDQRRDRAGFSLIELIVVIAILGILSVTVVMNIDSKTDDARVSSIQVDLKTLATAASMFRITFGRYPDSLEELIEPPEINDVQKYFLDDTPIDPYSNENYLYEVDDRGALFTSYGRDQVPGGEGYDADRNSRMRGSSSSP